MRQRILVSALSAGALAVVGATAAMASASGAVGAPTPYTAGKHAAKVCSATTAAHTAVCDAVKLVDAKGAAPRSSTPPSTGLTPSGLQDAYKLTGLKANGRTVITKRTVRQTPRHWKRGQRFDHRYATNYRVVSNYRSYHRLYTPPRGYHWVRSGNDAVLVAITGGLIGAVIGGAFN